MLIFFQRIAFGIIPIVLAFCLFFNVKQQPGTLCCKVLCPWWYQTTNSSYAGYRMVEDLNTCYANCRGDLKLIVMPESTFCFDIKTYQYFISLWCENLDDVTIIFGTHEHHDGGAYNVVYAICNGSIIFRYRKQHLMPFVEYHPKWLQWFGIAPFFHGVAARVPDFQDQNNDDIIMLEGQLYQIFVCSELFFQAKSVKGYPIILLWNDSYLRYDWIKQLALIFIQYFEWKYQIVVWHVSTTGISNIGKVDNI
ncbi:hypothetical protein KAZ82_01725 [Candidatus Babeliales bacterium]|nr:hypothetical protein [Candidatus Babeliales bacterium]